MSKIQKPYQLYFKTVGKSLSLFLILFLLAITESVLSDGKLFSSGREFKETPPLSRFPVFLPVARSPPLWSFLPSVGTRGWTPPCSLPWDLMHFAPAHYARQLVVHAI